MRGYKIAAGSVPLWRVILETLWAKGRCRERIVSHRPLSNRQGLCRGAFNISLCLQTMRDGSFFASHNAMESKMLAQLVKLDQWCSLDEKTWNCEYWGGVPVASVQLTNITVISPYWSHCHYGLNTLYLFPKCKRPWDWKTPGSSCQQEY